VVARYADGPQAGGAAITRRLLGQGSATYVSTRLAPSGLAAVLGPVCELAGVTSPLPAQLRGLVEPVYRGQYVFLINRGDTPVALDGLAGAPVAAPSLSGASLAPRGVTVLSRVEA
jgi:beta-galactosidase